MKLTGIIVTGLALLAAAETRADFDQANAAFAQQRYAEAASGYEGLIRERGYSVPVLFNLANAYYHDGQLGRAILNYERAQLLAPDAADVAHNLSVARRKAGMADHPPHWLGTYALSGLCSLAAVMIAVGFLFRQVTGRGAVGWIAANAVVLQVSMFALLLRFPERDRAIVVVTNVPAYKAPITVTQPLFTLSEGQPVSIREINGQFVLVEAGGGPPGWVATAAVERVTPL